MAIKKQRESREAITGEGSHKASAYELPVCDVDKDRRNFPGWHAIAPDVKLMIDVSCEGTTETRGGREGKEPYGSDTVELPRRFQ